LFSSPSRFFCSTSLLVPSVCLYLSVGTPFVLYSRGGGCYPPRGGLVPPSSAVWRPSSAAGARERSRSSVPGFESLFFCFPPPFICPSGKPAARCLSLILPSFRSEWARGSVAGAVQDPWLPSLLHSYFLGLYVLFSSFPLLLSFTRVPHTYTYIHPSFLLLYLNANNPSCAAPPGRRGAPHIRV
jgi:hypothetical protein